jgi:hypothetical protein
MEINQFNKEKAWDICRSVFPVVEKSSSFQSDFEKVRTGSDKNEMANKWAAMYIEQHGPEDYTFLLCISGVYFFT